MKYCWLFIPAAFLMVVTSCSGFTKPEIEQRWLKEWLEQPICEPPCWQSIIPGQTPITQAINLLGTFPFVTSLEGPEENGWGNNFWKWSFVDSDGGGLLEYSKLGEVKTLMLFIDEDLTLQDIIERYGQPTNIQSGGCHQHDCYLWITYMEQGLALGTSLGIEQRNPIKVEPKPNSIVDRIYFFSPGRENYPIVPGTPDDLLLEWEGYITYP